MEQEPQPKVIFGLSQRATIINAAVLLFLSQLFWCLCLKKQLPPEFNITTYFTEAANPYINNIPWYINMPLEILSMFMVLYWIENKYNIKKSDYSWRGIKYKFIYPICAFSIAGSAIKTILLLIFL